jgi:hypothetical protein
LSITIATAGATGASGTTTRTRKFAVKVLLGTTQILSKTATPSGGKWAVTWPALAPSNYVAQAGTASKAFTVAAPPPNRLFPDSPFWTPVGANPTLHSSSAAWTANFLAQGPWGPKPQGTEFGTNDWTRSYYEAKDTDPIRVIDGGLGGSWTEPTCEGRSIRVPQGARPAGGTHWQTLDGGFTARQPDNWLFSAWRSHDPVDGQAYQWAYIDGNGDGVRKTVTINGKSGEQAGIGQAKLGTRQGQVTYKELVVAQEIPHALVMEVNRWHARQWPGWPGDGKTRGGEVSDPNFAPMGARAYLAYTPTEINALSIPSWLKVIVRAIAEFGIYTYDNGGSAHSLDWESGIQFLTETGHNPWLDWSQSVGLPRSGTNSATGAPIYSADIQAQGKIDWSRLKWAPAG